MPFFLTIRLENEFRCFFLVFHQCIFTIFEFQRNNLSERKLNGDYNLLRQFSYWFRELNVFSTQNVNMKNSYWYCPNRVLEDQWECREAVVIITIYYQIFDVYIRTIYYMNKKNNSGLLLINKLSCCCRPLKSFPNRI